MITGTAKRAVVKFGFGAGIPKCCTITAYPVVQKQRTRTSRFASTNACTHYRRSIPRAHIAGVHTSVATRTCSTKTSTANMADSQIDASRWSRDALNEAISSGSFDHVLHWISNTQSSADAQEDADHVSPTKACDILIDRASEPLVIQGISSVLSKPVKSTEDFYTAGVGFDSIVSGLPLKTLRLYRSGIENLAASTQESPTGGSLPSLISRAKDAVKFIDDPELTWAPQHKDDFLGERSLTERVHTADQMKPHAKDLLGWLADYNWPPYPGCIKQLARFPEVTVDPIREIIAERRDDPEWLLHILEFVEEYVPIGVLWEKLEPELALLASSEAEDEENRDLVEAAERLLELLNEWKKEQGGNE